MFHEEKSAQIEEDSSSDEYTNTHDKANGPNYSTNQSKKDKKKNWTNIYFSRTTFS